MFAHGLDLAAAPDIDAALLAVPASRGVFAVFGRDPQAQPYISQSADLRRRLRRLLAAPEQSSKRLSLRSLAARVEWSPAGSTLEALLLLYAAYADPRQRLKLAAPPLLRFAMENAYPRVYVTTRLSLKSARNLIGPFASRVQAESYLESVLDLFLLRRCQPDLEPDPQFPGCIYSEMHKCLAPCFKGCTDARYAEEAEAVFAFLCTRGESLMAKVAAERDCASQELDFERAQALHDWWEKARAAALLAPALARCLPDLNAVVVEHSEQPDSVTLFLFSKMQFFGPLEFSTLGMRHGNEQSGSSSLFVQPVLLAPVPLADEGVASGASPQTPPQTLEARLAEALNELLQRAHKAPPASPALAQDHLALLRRWFYRPENQRTGEIFFADSLPRRSEPSAAAFPQRRLLRGISRVATGQRAAAAKPMQAEIPAPNPQAAPQS